MNLEKIASRLIESVEKGSQDVINLAEEISRLHGEMVSLLNESGKKLDELSRQAADKEEELKKLLAMRKISDDAKAAIGVFKEGKTNVGGMSSRLIDLLEGLSRTKIYPPTWPIEKAKWSIVEE